MPRINKVAHVVLNVGDIDASIEFYSKALGMEVVSHNKERKMAFLSFGTQHHDFGLFQRAAKDSVRDREAGQVGLNHIAMQIEGGIEELKVLYGRLLANGAQGTRTVNHEVTNSVYFLDPDGNRLEIFCETMDPEAGIALMRDGRSRSDPLELEPVMPGQKPA